MINLKIRRPKYQTDENLYLIQYFLIFKKGKIPTKRVQARGSQAFWV